MSDHDRKTCLMCMAQDAALAEGLIEAFVLAKDSGGPEAVATLLLGHVSNPAVFTVALKIALPLVSATPEETKVFRKALGTGMLPLPEKVHIGMLAVLQKVFDEAKVDVMTNAIDALAQLAEALQVQPGLGFGRINDAGKITNVVGVTGAEGSAPSSSHGTLH